MLIYENLIKSLQLVPKRTNAKLLLRHSIRPQSNEIETDFGLGLTREGKELANWFGKYLGGHLDKNFKVDIQRAKTSSSPRCKETAEMILKGYGKYIPIQEDRILHAMWIENKTKWEKMFKSNDKKIEPILQKMLDGENLDGVYPAYLSISKMLKVMDFFDISNKKYCEDSLYTLDIFTTHDSLIMLLLLYLLNKNVAEVDWIYMLEGCILWFENSILCIAWRGKKYNIKLESTIRKEIGL